MLSRFSKLALIAGAILMVGGTPPASAQGHGGSGGGGTVPPGTIYYAAGAYSYSTPTEYSMKGDGSSKTALFTGGFADVSYALHGGKRWSVRVQTHVDANGNLLAPPGVVFTDDRGASTEYTVDWGAIDYYPTGNMDSYVGEMKWVPGDSQISFVSRRVDAFHNVLDAGVYTLNVTYNAVTGSPSGADNLQIHFSTATVNNALLGPICPAQVYGHNWKADGSAAAFLWHDPWASPADAYRLCTVDTTVGSDGRNVIKTILTGGVGPHIAWGGAGKIVFGGSSSSSTSALLSIPEAGGTLTTLDSIKNGTNTYYFFTHPRWSPDGAYLAYNLETVNSSFQSKPDTATIRRVNAGGGGIITLADLKNWTQVSAWR